MVDKACSGQDSSSLRRHSNRTDSRADRPTDLKQLADPYSLTPGWFLSDNTSLPPSYILAISSTTTVFCVPFFKTAGSHSCNPVIAEQCVTRWSMAAEALTVYRAVKMYTFVLCVCKLSVTGIL